MPGNQTASVGCLGKQDRNIETYSMFSEFEYLQLVIAIEKNVIVIQLKSFFMAKHFTV